MRLLRRAILGLVFTYFPLIHPHSMKKKYSMERQAWRKRKSEGGSRTSSPVPETNGDGKTKHSEPQAAAAPPPPNLTASVKPLLSKQLQEKVAESSTTMDTKADVEADVGSGSKAKTRGQRKSKRLQSDQSPPAVARSQRAKKS